VANERSSKCIQGYTAINLILSNSVDFDGVH
jgi:hypothetical protein